MLFFLLPFSVCLLLQLFLLQCLRLCLHLYIRVCISVRVHLCVFVFTTAHALKSELDDVKHPNKYCVPLNVC
jgi:hypothetical protein